MRVGDEIALVSGAGFAAGVDAATGRLRWVQALPRFTDVGGFPEGWAGVAGFSPHNVPMAGHGAWFIAAEDAPFPVAVEAGTGRLRWVGISSHSDEGALRSGSERPPESPEQLRLEAGEDGSAAVSYSGGPRALCARDATSGRLIRGMGVATLQREIERASWYETIGRPFVAGGSVLAFRQQSVRVLDPVTTDRLGPWRERARPMQIPAAADEGSGDLLRVADLWIGVSQRRVIAWAEPRVAAAVAVAPGRDAADRAARACLRARLEPSDTTIAAAIAACAAQPDVRARGLPPAVDAWLASGSGLAAIDRPEALQAALATVDALEPAARARAYLAIFRGLEKGGRDALIVALLEGWMAFGSQALVDVERSGAARVRSDLFAARALPAAAARSAPGREALARREIVTEAALASALTTGDEPRWLDAMERAGGTVAQWTARTVLLARRIDAARYAEAAAVAADLRTSAPVGVDVGSAAAHALRALEADLLARAGEAANARLALFEADRDGPALARGVDGGAAFAISRRLHAASGPASGTEPEGRLELLAGDRTPSERARRDVFALEPAGPGAVGDVDRVIVARGLEFEIRSLPTGDVTPVTPLDAAFVGATFHDREPSLPGPGVRVASVIPGAAADRAGLRAGDWIVRLGDDDVRDRATLVRSLARSPVAAPIAVTLLRRGERVVRSLSPSRRTPDDRTPPIPSSTLFPGDGTAIVASRFGLARVDLSTGAAAPIWTCRHPGQVVEFLSFAGVVYVLIGTSPLGDTTVVAVEAATGRERWATPLEGGTSTRPRATGSALVVDTLEPDRTVLLDRGTGGVRASYTRDVPDDDTPIYPARTPSAHGSVEAGGVVWLWRGGWSHARLSSLDPTSGMVVRDVLTDAPTASAILATRPLAGGALLATAAAVDTIWVFLPDLRGGVEPFGTLPVDRFRFGSGVSGDLDESSQVVVGGDSVFVARLPNNRLATVGAAEIDRRAARGLSAGDAVIWHPPTDPLLKPATVSTGRTRSDFWPAFASVRATLDGVWVAATYWDVGMEGAAGRTVWFSPGFDAFVPIGTENSVLYTRGPVFVGRRALVPTDGGYVLVRLPGGD